MPQQVIPTDPQTLLGGASCFNCYGTPGEMALMKLALLRQILLQIDPMADTSPQTLLSQANCYNCYGPGMWALIELALLNLIVQNGGGSGGLAGTGSPQGAVAANPGTTYVDTGTDNLWVNTNGTINGWVIISIPSTGASAYYASPGPPIGTPAANGLLNIIVDSNGQQWQYYAGAWH